MTATTNQRALAAGLVMAVTLNAFEAVAVVTAMPAISKELNGDRLYGAAFSAYMLANLVALVVGGEQSDRRGPAAPFLGGVAVFAVGLVVAGLAPTMEIVLLGRVLQGAGLRLAGQRGLRRDRPGLVDRGPTPAVRAPLDGVGGPQPGRARRRGLDHRAGGLALGLPRAAAPRPGPPPWSCPLLTHRIAGNFWQDLTRTLLYVLLPISFVGALFLVSQGVIQNLVAVRTTRHARRRRADACAGPGRLAGGDQDARHQRRRLLQRQQRDAVREPDRALRTSSSCCSILAIPAGADRDVRPHGRQPPPGLGALRRDARVLFVGAMAASTPPRATARRHSTTPASSRQSDGSRAATSRARSSASGSPTARCGTTATTVASSGSVNSALRLATRASAAWCRWPTCAPAR